MPLPQGFLTPETQRLQAYLDTLTPQQVGQFPPLRRTDMQIIGAYIQIYNYLDTHLRRAVEIFVRREMLPESVRRKYRRIPASKLVETVRPVVAAMPRDIEDVDLALLHLENIERGRPLRNLLAHWAARRFPQDEALLLLTKHEPDAESIGFPLNEYGAATAIIPVNELRERMLTVGSYENWFGVKIAEWFKRYVGD
jgi:hypothetical protein